MVSSCGYPRSLIAVEGSAELGRRFDILCYAKKGEKLYPLLLIECKAGALNRDAEQQLLGYNEKLQAPFVCLANGRSLETIWYERGERRSVPFLPSYQHLYDVYLRQ
jgi:hypothetical protein